MTFDLSDAWGYGALTIPKLLFWQGFKIIDPHDPDLRDDVHDVIVKAEQVVAQLGPGIGYEITSEGCLGAVIAELFSDALKTGGVPQGLSAHASAFSELTGHRFWIIDAEIGERGTGTRHTMLAVSTAEAARDEINRRVMPLKMGQSLKLMKSRK
jgi:hypothetical protein